MPRTKKNSRKQRKPRKVRGGWSWPWDGLFGNSTNTGAASTGDVGKVPTDTGAASTGDVGKVPAVTGDAITGDVGKVQGGGKGRKSRKNHKKSVKGKSKK